MVEGKNNKNSNKVKVLAAQKGKNIRRCKRCGSTKGLIRKYGLYICRRCFREIANELGFFKYR